MTAPRCPIRSSRPLLWCIALLAGCPAWLPAFAGHLPDEAFDKAPAIAPPAAADVKAQALAWLETAGAAATREQATPLWADEAELPAGELLDRLAATLALGDQRIRDLLELCSGPPRDLAPPDQAWLTDEKLPPLVRNNMRLVYGRWLARERFYEEAMTQLDGLAAGDVVDPASLLFYQGVCCHWLLKKDEGLKAIGQLDDVAGSPVRYVTVAGLMRADLEALETDSLDEISRMMGDIERRLDLGRPGPKTVQVENDVIAKLDKLIEEMEKQQQQQQQQAASGGTMRPNRPASDSVPMQGKGPGLTNKKNIGSKSGWGDLPPKERQEALQQIGKDFP
jgi:hypothetical protein